MGLWRWIGASKARSFGRARSGNVAMMWALCGVALIGLTGLTVDFTRAQSIRAQLQNAADGAVLTAERSSNLPMSERTAAARAYFDAEVGELAQNVTFTVTQLDTGGHRVTADYHMPLSLARVINKQDWVVHVESEAQSDASPPIEVVMVLDNTYSMVNDMGSLRDAASDLADSLLALDGDSVSVGLVPFEAYVNIGNDASHMAWMDTAGTAPLNGEILEGRLITRTAASSTTSGGGCSHWWSCGGGTTTYSCSSLSTTVGASPYPITWVLNGSNCDGYNPADGINYFTLFDHVPNASWKGCVEARPEPYDISDDPPDPSNPATMFVPFFYLDDSDTTGGVPNNWLNDQTLPPGTIQSGGRTLSVFKYDGTNGSLNETYQTQNARGPNRGCPTPIVPLTSSKSTIDNAINAMRVWAGGGTNSAAGLAWGWRVVSHGEPFGEGRDPAQEDVRKVIVLMTDGENTNGSANSENGVLQSFDNAFGYRGQWTNFQNDVPVEYRRNIGNSESSYVNYVNGRLSKLCTNIKDDHVEIYTVVFREPSQSIRTLLRNCASGDDHAYTADSSSDLKDVFHAIGSGIGNLRLTR
jgi:Flp pilus assembly protein TadG